MTKLTPAVLAFTLLAGVSGVAMAQDHEHDRGGGSQAAPQQPHQAPPGGGHWQGGPQGGPRGGEPGGQPHVQAAPGGAPAGPRGGGHWEGARPGAEPGGHRWEGGAPGGPSGGDHRFQGGPPQAVNPGGPRDWNRDRTQVTPPPPEGSRWEGRHDPRGGDGRGQDWRDRDDRGRGPEGWRGRDHDGWRGGGAWGHGPGGGPAHWAPGRYPSMLWAQNRFHIGPYRPPYGYYVRAWAFGDYLPRPWFAQPYWIGDFIDYDLPYPPPGFVWVRVGPDALMIDEYSGQIVQVVRGVFW